MYFLHSIKQGTLNSVLKSGFLIPQKQWFGQKAVWFSALPRLINKIDRVDHIHKQNIWVFNRGPVLVFDSKDMIKYGLSIQKIDKVTGDRKYTDIDDLEKHIKVYFNHDKNLENTIQYSRWFHSHSIWTRSYISIADLKCIMLYTDRHYDEMFNLHTKIPKWVDVSGNNTSFETTYRLIDHSIKY